MKTTRSSTTIKRVYGQPRTNNPQHIINPIEPSHDDHYHSKSIQEQMDEIDRLTDQELSNITSHQPSQPLPPPLPLPSSSLGPIESTSSPSPITPHDLSPPSAITIDAHHHHPHSLPSSPPLSLSLHPPPKIPNTQLDSIHLSDPSPISHPPPPVIESSDPESPWIQDDQLGHRSNPTHPNPIRPTRRIIDSDEESPSDSTPPVPKSIKQRSTKLKGLSKKEREETQRMIASCQRQKDLRLIAACRAPLTKLEDIITKATTITQPKNHPESSSHSSFHSASHSHQSNSFNSSLAKSRKSNGVGDHVNPPDRLPTSPIRDVSDQEALDSHGNVSAHQSPTQDKLTANSKDLPEDVLKKSKKKWLENQRSKKSNAIDHPAPSQPSSTHPRSPVALDDSDSDLDIVHQPNHPDHHDSLFTQRLTNRHRTESKSSDAQKPSQQSRLIKSFFGSVPIALPPVSNPKMNPKSSTTVQPMSKKRDGFMRDLLAKSAVDGALLRRQKLTEFVERGGRLAKELETSAQVDLADPKSIFKDRREPDDDQTQIDINSDEELGSMDEIELSGEEAEEEEQEQEEEEEEYNDDDEIEDSEEDLAKRDLQIDLEKHDEGEDGTPRPTGHQSSSKNTQRSLARNLSSSNALMLPPPIKRTSGSMSSETTTGSSTGSLPSGQTIRRSKILVLDSTSTHPTGSSDRDEVSRPPVLLDNSDQSSPIELPGFQGLDVVREPTSTRSRKSPLTGDSATPLPGFELVDSTPLDGFGDDSADESLSSQFGGPKKNTKPIRRIVEGDGGDIQLDNEPGFTQLFENDDGVESTHPPPIGLLKSKTDPPRDDDGPSQDRVRQKSIEEYIPSMFLRKTQCQEENEIEDLDSTCVLPAVHVLPEERDRDMAMMMLDAQKACLDDDESPIQYVNHRGLLTQNKPSDSNPPPDSPLMSQDVIARTPFALRKDHTNWRRDLMDRDVEDDQSPTKSQAFGTSQRNSMAVKPIEVENGFTRLMNGQKEQALHNHQSTSKVPKTKFGGNRKVFLADEAEESEDEFEGLGRRRQGPFDDDDDQGSQEEDEEGILKDLVDDGEDIRDEQTKLEGDLALKELARQHSEEADRKRTEQAQKIIAGKVRIHQARNHGPGQGGGLSDSDSEDDQEVELIKANRRAQEHAAKKRKRAIHSLAEKHLPFFKSYEEGTCQWADEDDLACLHPQEEDRMKKSDDDDDDEDEEEEEEEDEEEEKEGRDDDEFIDNEPIDGPMVKPSDRNKKIGSGGGLDDSRESKRTKLDDSFVGLSSSPDRHHPSSRLAANYKIIQNPFRFSARPSKLNHHPNRRPSDPEAHDDVDKMYDELGSTKNSMTEERRLQVMNEFGGAHEFEEVQAMGSHRVGGGSTSRRQARSGMTTRSTNSKSSSITYQQQQQRRRQVEKPSSPRSRTRPREQAGDDHHRETRSTSSRASKPPVKGLGRLSRLKQKKSEA